MPFDICPERRLLADFVEKVGAQVGRESDEACFAEVGFAVSWALGPSQAIWVI
jgi:hypothetical protein